MVAQKNRVKLKVEKLTEEDVKIELAGFESKYGMTSKEFITKYNSSQFEEENLELMEWAGYYYIAGRMGMLDESVEA